MLCSILFTNIKQPEILSLEQVDLFVHQRGLYNAKLCGCYLVPPGFMGVVLRYCGLGLVAAGGLEWTSPG